MNNDKLPVSIRLTQDMKEKLNFIAKEEKRSLSSLIIYVLHKYIEKEHE